MTSELISVFFFDAECATVQRLAACTTTQSVCLTPAFVDAKNTSRDLIVVGQFFTYLCNYRLTL